MNFFTELREGLLISLAAIHANKMRAALTTLVAARRVSAGRVSASLIVLPFEMGCLRSRPRLQG